MTRKKQKEVLALIKEAIAASQFLVDRFRGSTNPCHKEMVSDHMGRMEAFRSCYNAIEGDLTHLKIDAMPYNEQTQQELKDVLEVLHA